VGYHHDRTPSVGGNCDKKSFSECGMPTQLHLYTINRDHLRQFSKEWKEKVLPLRIEHGFEIQRAWIIESSSQFAWIIIYEGTEGWEAKERTYYASAERSDMKPNPARWIARAEEYFVEDIL
jgi:hypothetical protein